MKYLTLAPDYTNSCLKDDFDGYIQLAELNLSNDLIRSLQKWHEDYRAIIPLSTDQRRKVISKIYNLDKIAIDLAKKISKEVAGGAKIKYFSEGQLKYLAVM